MNRKHRFILFLIITLMLVACARLPILPGKEDGEAEQTAAAEADDGEAQSPESEPLVIPTNVPLPTAIPLPPVNCDAMPAELEAELDAPRQISVSGQAEINVVPDQVVFTLQAETYDKELDEAKKQNDVAVIALFDLAEEYGIEPGDINVDHIYIQPTYGSSYSSYSGRDKEGFSVRKTVVITLRDLSQFDGFFSDIVETGFANVQGIIFASSELQHYRDQARAQAVRAAHQKATEMAAELCQTPGQPLTISENRIGWYSSYAGGGSSGSSWSQSAYQDIESGTVWVSGAAAPGLLAVFADVSVTFELHRN